MITTLPARCWRLVSHDGIDYDPFDEGATPHFISPAKVAEAFGVEELTELGLTAREFDLHCCEIVCDGCGCRYEDRDTGSVVHFPDEETATALLTPLVDGDEFRRCEDGTTRCEVCAEALYRDELRKVGG